MATLSERLEQIASDLQEGDASPDPTIREFLSWAGAKRRGYKIVQNLRSALKAAGLATVPDFEGAFIDSTIRFVLSVGDDSAADEVAADEDDTEDDPLTAALDDPTYRLSKLAAANRVPVSVKPNATLQSAVTTMLLHDFSQLPVMTTERDVKGVVSWQSIGSRLALGRSDGSVREFMESHVEASATASLFSVIERIVEKQYVLVREVDRRVVGIITASDLSLQFRQLSEPFLLLGEIENHVRRLIHDTFSVEDLRAALDPDGPSREVESVADLTFGEFVWLLQKSENWKKLGTKIDRGVFVARLDEIRRIRNDVMHFDPDGIPDEDVAVLRDFARFLQRTHSIGDGD